MQVEREKGMKDVRRKGRGKGGSEEIEEFVKELILIFFPCLFFFLLITRVVLRLVDMLVWRYLFCGADVTLRDGFNVNETD